MSSQNIDDSAELVDIQTANRSKMLQQYQKRGAKPPSVKSLKSESASNYAQQVHGDLISQVLSGGASSVLPPVPDSPSLQHQNMPKKQPLKNKLASRQISRQQSANSYQGNSQNENPNERASSRGQKTGSHLSAAAALSGHNVRHSEDFSAREVRRQKTQQQTAADLNLGPRRQSSKGLTKTNLPPTHSGQVKRTNSRQKSRGSQQLHNHSAKGADENYSADAKSTGNRSMKGGYNNVPVPRRPTQTSSARSLNPIDGSSQAQPQSSHNLNPKQVVPTPPSHLNKPSKKVSQLSQSVDKQKELLAKLQAERQQMEAEMHQNESFMQDKIITLAEERKNIEKLILKSTITIQRFARGFITRIKVRKVYHLQMEFEKARLDDALAQMQAMINDQAKNAPITPAKTEYDSQNTSYVEAEKSGRSQAQIVEQVVQKAQQPISEIENNKLEQPIEINLADKFEQKQESSARQSERHQDMNSNQSSSAMPRSLTELAQPKHSSSSSNISEVDRNPASIVLSQEQPSQILKREDSHHRQSDSYKNESQHRDKEPEDQNLDLDFQEDSKLQTQTITAIAGSQEVLVEQNDRGILDQLEAAESDYDIDLDDEKYSKAAVVIQRQAHVMIARNNFRVALYKLILLKNIVDTKVHKERMQVLYAFEQLIINTEDLGSDDSQDDQADTDRDAELDEQTKFIEQTGLTREQIQEVLAAETDPYLRQQLEELYNPMVFKGLNEAEQFFENTEDIINEEDLEESVCESRKQSPLHGTEKANDTTVLSGEQIMHNVSQTKLEDSSVNDTAITASAMAGSQRVITSEEVKTVKQDDESKQESEPISRSKIESARASLDKQNLSQQLIEKLNTSLSVKSDKDAPKSSISSVKPPSSAQSKLSNLTKQSNTQTIKTQSQTKDKITATTASRQAQSLTKPSQSTTKLSSATAKPALTQSKPLQEKTIISTNTQSRGSLRLQQQPATSKQIMQNRNRQSTTSIKNSSQQQQSRDLSSEQGKQSTASMQQKRPTAQQLLSSKPLPTKTISDGKVVITGQKQKLDTNLPGQSKQQIKHEVTRKDILEFSGQPTDELTEELQQSGQINIVTARNTIPSSSHSRMSNSDTASQNGSRPSVKQPRDTSIIERNKAKLAALAEKRLQEKNEKKAEEIKQKEAKEAAAKPPRPFDASRLDSLSQPKPKKTDPNTKPETKTKKVSAQTRRQLQERAIRVKSRQMEAMEKNKGKSKMLAITDGQSQGSNLVVVNNDERKSNMNDDKRRSNIIKSRELRKRSASGRRDSAKSGSVFDRLSAAAQLHNAAKQKASQDARNNRRQSSSGAVRVSLDGQLGQVHAASSRAMVPYEQEYEDQWQEKKVTSKILAIEPSRDEFEPVKPSSDVRQSIEFVVKKGGAKQNQNRLGVSSSKNSSHWNGADKFDFVGSTMTDNDPETTDIHIPAGRDSYTNGQQDNAFSMRQLRKQVPQAQAVQLLDESDEIDDMPFIVKGRKPKPAAKIQVNTRAKGQQLEPLPHREGQASRGSHLSSNTGQDRKPITGASKISDSAMYVMHNTGQSSQQSAPSHLRVESNSTLEMFGNPARVTNQGIGQVVANPDENKGDWLLDPVNLYMRGMAQKREQMKKLQAQIGQEQRAEINRRVANFKM